MDVEPEVEGLAEVFNVGRFAGLHDGAIGLFELRADHLGEDVPVAPAVQIVRCDPADPVGFVVRKGDAPLAVEADNRFGHLADEPRQIVALGIFAAATGAGPHDRRFDVDGVLVGHKGWPYSVALSYIGSAFLLHPIAEGIGLELNDAGFERLKGSGEEGDLGLHPG